MKTSVTTLALQITSSEFICEKLKESLSRTCQFYVDTNKRNLEIHGATMRGLIEGDTSSEVVRKGISDTHRKIQFAQQNLSDWGAVLTELQSLEVKQEAVEETDNLDDIIASYK